MSKNNPQKVITGLVRLSYAHIWEPQSINGSDPKYSCSLIIRKNDKKTLDEIEDAIKAAIEAGKPMWGGKIPVRASLKMPLRDGDVERPDDPAYTDCYWINANSKIQPSIVDRNVRPILNEDEVYSGCYAHASISFYPFNKNGNRGIAAGLNHIQKIKDGEPFGGRTAADEDFSAVEDEDLLG
jgi:hypothetical protein